jgi:hypothetical protein
MYSEVDHGWPLENKPQTCVELELAGLQLLGLALEEQWRLRLTLGVPVVAAVEEAVLVLGLGSVQGWRHLLMAVVGSWLALPLENSIYFEETKRYLSNIMTLCCC